MKQSFKQSFQKLPLGLPLTASGIATIATIFAGKKIHTACGAVWGVISILHGLQHAGGNSSTMPKPPSAARRARQQTQQSPSRCTPSSPARISLATCRAACASTTSPLPATKSSPNR